MGRRVLAVAVVVADTALMVAAHRHDLPWWAVVGYVLAVGSLVAAGRWAPVGAFVAAVAFAALTGGAFVLLLWCAYRAGRAVPSRSRTAVLVGAALGGAGAQLATRPSDPRMVSSVLVTSAVFVALPLLAGRYLAQHERLVTALDRVNRQLRQERTLLAERERLRERLRIARDMHDSLGRRLSLVSVQAAALEVAALPPAHRDAVRHLATAAREATTGLYELVGALRADDPPPGPGADAVAALVAQFQAAGVLVSLRHGGRQRDLSPAAGQVAYRVVEEGLTNAAKHAPGQPVTVNVDWEADALLLTVANPLAADAPPAPVAAEPGLTGHGVSGHGLTGHGLTGHGLTGHGLTGHGLTGLAERVRPVGGLLDHRSVDGTFRLVAMLPTGAPATDEEALPGPGRVRTAAIALAMVGVMFVILPASMLLGAAPR